MRLLSPVSRLSFTSSLASEDDGVGWNLVAAAELHDVVDDDLVEVELHLQPVAHDLHLLLVASRVSLSTMRFERSA